MTEVGEQAVQAGLTPGQALIYVRAQMNAKDDDKVFGCGRE